MYSALYTWRSNSITKSWGTYPSGCFLNANKERLGGSPGRVMTLVCLVGYNPYFSAIEMAESVCSKGKMSENSPS